MESVIRVNEDNLLTGALQAALEEDNPFVGMEESDMRNHLEALDSEDRRCEVAHKALRGIMEQI